jgi:DNA-binding beta-propeller fold protein YncE
VKLESVTRFDAQDTSIVDYQYSVKGDEPVTANPQSIAFSSQNKAYLTRRSSDSLWVIDPQAATEADFKLDEIDLGAYDIDLPDMTDAIIVDDKLFVLLERLNELPSGFQIPDKVGYLAVFNTITDTEIDTGMGRDGLQGVELLVTNPTSLQYNEETGLIYVVGRGNYYENDSITGDFHSGGVQSIDPTSYQQSLLLDDGTDADNQGYFVEAEIINASQGYLIAYQSWGISTLRTFNPVTGELSENVFPELQDADITTIAKGSDNHLWIGINDATPGFYRLDLATGELAPDRITTELVPLDLVFIAASQP